ncbi:MAG: GntR family transcriptional regulator [Ottowia sp.]|uniref:GntR family transcriptional regulator n=1 Tax=Ottowia sp. TaxID=1898956 RepID=UPI003C743F6E
MAKRPALIAVFSDELPQGDDAGLPRTLIERAYTQLRDDIVEGRILPGEKLRVEHLRLRYGVSAGTLREALNRLVSDALVEAEGQRGFRVTPVTMQDLDDLTDLRVRIEIEALRQSIRHANAPWREELQQAYTLMSDIERPLLPERVQRWEAANTQFHEVLVANCGSAWTLRLLRILNRHSERYRRFAIGIGQGRRNVHDEHRGIFEAAMAGNELRAALELEAHIRATPELLKAAAREGVDIFSAYKTPAGCAQSAHPAHREGQ